MTSQYYEPKIWPPKIWLKLKIYYINQGPWTWNKKNYINISHRKKVYLAIHVRISAIVKVTAGLLNKLFSYERYWCNFFCFMFRDLDLYNKFSISAKSKVVKFSAIVLWHWKLKMAGWVRVFMLECSKWSHFFPFIILKSSNHRHFCF